MVEHAGTVANESFRRVGSGEPQPTVAQELYDAEHPLSVTLPAARPTAASLRSALAGTAPSAASSAPRTTVLPRLEMGPDGDGPILVPQEKPRYREVGKLGEGGLGEVTLALDEDIGRSVAIKRLHDQQDRGQLLRFVDEVRLTGRLDHPNIVPLHDVGCDDSGRFYFVMKRLEGDTLDAIIERLRDGDPATHRRFPMTVRLEIFLGVLRAIEFAHSQRIVHRDLKPANIMVGRYGEVVVMDWGIAKRLDDPLSDALDATVPPEDEVPTGTVMHRQFHTRIGTLLGTPAYMSPEQARGDLHLCDERSDLYSLAVVLYELVTLRHYLEEFQDLSSLLDAVRVWVPEKATLVRHPHSTGVPVEVSVFLDRAMAKRPDDRYASAGEMIEAMRDVMCGTFSITCPVTLAKRAVTGLGRLIDNHPRTVFFGMVGSALATLGGAVAGVVHLLS